MAPLERIAPNLRAVLAAHVPLQFVDGRRLRPADNVQGHCLVGVAAEAADLKERYLAFSASPRLGEG